MPPDNRDDDAVPECPDAALAVRVNAFGVLPAKNLVTQRGAENANHTVDGRGDDWDLDSARPGEIGETSVVVSADCIGRDFFGGIVSGIG